MKLKLFSSRDNPVLRHFVKLSNSARHLRMRGVTLLDAIERSHYTCENLYRQGDDLPDLDEQNFVRTMRHAFAGVMGFVYYTLRLGWARGCSAPSDLEWR